MNHDRVAVRRALCDDVRSYRAGCATTIVYDELLSGGFGELLRDDARNDVVRPAWRPWHNDTHGSDWIDLRADGAGNQSEN
jgi:hypothetical protein